MRPAQRSKTNGAALDPPAIGARLEMVLPILVQLVEPPGVARLEGELPLQACLEVWMAHQCGKVLERAALDECRQPAELAL